MKKLLLPFLSIFALGLNAQLTLVQENFDGMNSIETVAGQSNNFEQFSCNDYEIGAPYISTEQFVSSPNSMKLTWGVVGENDDPPSIFMITDLATSGILTISFQMYVLDESYPTILLNHDFGCNDEDIESSGILLFGEGGVVPLMDINTEEDILFPNNEWFEVSVSINFLADIATMQIADSPEFSWQWSLYLGADDFVQGLYQFQSLAIAGDSNFGSPGSVYIDNVLVTQGTSVGVSETTNQDISFFPNPANDRVTFRGNFENATVRIIDLSGKLVLQKALNSSNPTFSLNALNDGLYLLEIINGNERTTRKLVVNH